MWYRSSLSAWTYHLGDLVGAPGRQRVVCICNRSQALDPQTWLSKDEVPGERMCEKCRKLELKGTLL